MVARTEYDYVILGEHIDLPVIDSDSETKEEILLAATILFATKGFTSISMRDIADAVGIKPASLYNHFASKEAMWHAVVHHAKELYLLYFKFLDKALEKAASFDEVLEIIFHEPKKMTNIFTCYAFSMLQMEQFRDQEAAQVFTEVIMQYSIDFFSKWFEKCIARRLAPRFDTKIVASIIMHAVLNGLEVKVQTCLGRPAAYEPTRMIADLQKFIRNAVMRDQE